MEAYVSFLLHSQELPESENVSEEGGGLIVAAAGHSGDENGLRDVGQ